MVEILPGATWRLLPGGGVSTWRAFLPGATWRQPGASLPGLPGGQPKVLFLAAAPYLAGNSYLAYLAGIPTWWAQVFRSTCGGVLANLGWRRQPGLNFLPVLPGLISLPGLPGAKCLPGLPGAKSLPGLPGVKSYLAVVLLPGGNSYLAYLAPSLPGGGISTWREDSTWPTWRDVSTWPTWRQLSTWPTWRDVPTWSYLAATSFRT